MKLPVNYNKIDYRKRREVREQYVKLQGGLCYYCGNPLDEPPSKSVMKRAVNISLFPKGFFNWSVHLHHNHNTGMTIGAVHCYCNAVLWQYEGE